MVMLTNQKWLRVADKKKCECGNVEQVSQLELTLLCSLLPVLTRVDFHHPVFKQSFDLIRSIELLMSFHSTPLHSFLTHPTPCFHIASCSIFYSIQYHIITLLPISLFILHFSLPFRSTSFQSDLINFIPCHFTIVLNLSDYKIIQAKKAKTVLSKKSIT